MTKLKRHAQFVGDAYIRTLEEMGAECEDKAMAHVSSTYYGGGVAEMLTSYVPLLNDAGLPTEWRLLKGSREFFTVTKKMHNALQGMPAHFSQEDIRCYEEAMEENAQIMNLDWYDLVVIDDPQPAGLITRFKRGSPSLWKPLPILSHMLEIQRKQPWVWRAHIDLSFPDKRAWAFLKRYVERFDAVVTSSEQYKVPVRKHRFITTPAIDPLSDKNRPLSDAEMHRELSKYGIEEGKPLMVQVSRLDPWKDPLGVMSVYRKVKKVVDCQLVLIGSMASDDPEGEKIFNEVFREAEREKRVHLITAQNDLLVNALQRKADVVVQKSLREGFGLTVSEAMWKGTPVVASRVGGIPLQIDDGVNGYLVDGIDECADRVAKLLRNRAKARELGRNGVEKVRKNFLITRLVKDELSMFREMTRSSAHKLVDAQQRKLSESVDFFRKMFRV